MYVCIYAYSHARSILLQARREMDQEMMLSRHRGPKDISFPLPPPNSALPS